MFRANRVKHTQENMIKRSAWRAQYAPQGKHWSRTAPWSRTLGAAQSARKDFILFRLVLLVGLARIVALKVKMNFQKSAAEIIWRGAQGVHRPVIMCTPQIPRRQMERRFSGLSFSCHRKEIHRSPFQPRKGKRLHHQHLLGQIS